MIKKIDPDLYRRIVRDIERLREQGRSLERIRDFIYDYYGIKFSKQGILFIISRLSKGEK